MLSYSDGYLTAWFMYWLKGKMQADFFSEETAEILINKNWQDIQKYMTSCVVYNECKCQLQNYLRLFACRIV